MDTTYNAYTPSGLPDPVTDHQFYEGVPFRRLAAWIVDAVLILITGALAVLVLGVATLGIAFFFAFFIAFVTSFVYRTVFLATKSATPGMMLMGIEFRTARGERFTLREAVFHTGIFMVVFSSFLGQLVSCVLMVTTEHGRGIPDFVLGTTAINRPVQ